MGKSKKSSEMMPSDPGFSHKKFAKEIAKEAKDVPMPKAKKALPSRKTIKKGR